MGQAIRKRFIFIIIDLIVVVLSYLLVVYAKSGALAGYLQPKYTMPFLLFLVIWLVISALFKKYAFRDYDKFKRVLVSVLPGNIFILGVVSIFIYFFYTFYFSRLLVLGTIVTASLVELGFGFLYHFVRVAKDHEIPVDHEFIALKKHKENGNGNGNNHSASAENFTCQPLSESLEGMLLEKTEEAVVNFIARNNLFQPHEILALATADSFNIRAQASGKYKYIVNIKRINDIRDMNGFFTAVNDYLPRGGYYTCCVETKDMRKKRLFRKYMFPFNFLYYYMMDFPLKRVMPKLKTTRGLYFLITRGQNQVITRAETLGRLIAYGFDIVDEEYTGQMCYITASKKKNPVVNLNPSYGPVIRLKRVGKDGQPIRVYKMRTMHPFAEYLQDYIYDRYNLDEGGKFNNDFRISTQGKIMRKLWIDELPMLINWLRRDMKFVGVRPISEQYFKLYSKEHRQLRFRYKPGLVPPYYADLPKTLEEIEDSEHKYLESFEKNPFQTDWHYFWRAMYNIVFRKARSK